MGRSLNLADIFFQNLEPHFNPSATAWPSAILEAILEIICFTPPRIPPEENDPPVLPPPPPCVSDMAEFANPIPLLTIGLTKYLYVKSAPPDKNMAPNTTRRKMPLRQIFQRIGSGPDIAVKRNRLKSDPYQSESYDQSS